MSNTMTQAAAEPISYLDSVLNDEEKRCEYGHEWRNFTISRSGRFKSKNRKRDKVDGKFFDDSSRSVGGGNSATGSSAKELEKLAARQPMAASQTKKSYQQPATTTTSKTTTAASNTKTREKVDSYKSFYETNL